MEPFYEMFNRQRQVLNQIDIKRIKNSILITGLSSRGKFLWKNVIAHIFKGLFKFFVK